MSYVLKIWENPVDLSFPVSIDDAVRLLSLFENARPGLNPKFLLLAQRLTKRFPTPDMVSAKGEAEAVSGVAWSEWPITGNTEAAVWCFGLNEGFDENVRSFVMQEATAQGLCVMDEQLGEVYLPNGKILCLPGRAPLSGTHSVSDDPPKTKDVLARLYEYLVPLMHEYGFKGKKRNLAFRRLFPEGWHEVYLWAPVERWPLCAEVAVTVTVRIHKISDLRANIIYPDRPVEEFCESWTLIGHQNDWIEGDEPFLAKTSRNYQVYHQSEIESVEGHLVSSLRLRVFPALEVSRTVGDVDRILNSPEKNKPFFSALLDGKENVISAYLANNPNLEDICRKFDPRLYGRWEPALASCIDYVKSRVQQEKCSSFLDKK